MTRPVLVILYIVMASWLIFAAFNRVLLQILGGFPLDPLPLISVTLGVSAIVALFVSKRTPG